jgi:predicted AlkP superfamily phosphohydrolase/phosphomutase
MDAAEPSFVLDLIERGELPTLERLHQEGSWTSLRSSAHVGSESVYPTFFTGTEPRVHGIHGGWSWNPETMSVVQVRTNHLRPFWESLEDQGLTVGVLDFPMAPHVGLSRGFEVTEWGPHVSLWEPTEISPHEVAPAVNVEHPFASGRLQAGAENHFPEHPALASGCIEGASVRGDLAERLLERTSPDLAIVVFAEVHRTAHDLWHTVEPGHPLYKGLPPDAGSPGLLDVYREVDRQIGRLCDTAGEDAAIVVFSLHGMRPARGIAGLLQPALQDLGFAQPARTVGSIGSLRHAALAGVKRSTPLAVKQIYHRRVPRETRDRVAARTMLPALDWSQTRAFSLPSDQHGWVRLNLQGREAAGSVAPEDYERTCQELEEALAPLCTEDGRPLVSDVIRPDPGGPPPLLPDLIVHWTDAALDEHVRVREPAIQASRIVPHRTGQHSTEGFCLARGLDPAAGESLALSELPSVLLRACGR